MCDASSLFLNAEKGVSFFYRFGRLVFAIIAVIGSIGRIWIFLVFRVIVNCSTTTGYWILGFCHHRFLQHRQDLDFFGFSCYHQFLDNNRILDFWFCHHRFLGHRQDLDFFSFHKDKYFQSFIYS